MQGSGLFLDTSIQIARVIHGPETKKRIADRIAQYNITVSSSVVQQEFKRRLLAEAAYLLRLFDKHNSYERVMRYVIDVLPPKHYRKRNISLELLETIFEDADDAELTDRSRSYLRALLLNGMQQLEDSTGHILSPSMCACSKYPIVEKKPYKRYEFGPDRCSRVSDSCSIVSFLRQHKQLTHDLLGFLQEKNPNVKSTEITNAEAFLERVLGDAEAAPSLDPCTTVGDLLIALESKDIPSVYTMNVKESRHYCEFLGQELIFRSPNYQKDDEVNPVAVSGTK